MCARAHACILHVTGALGSRTAGPPAPAGHRLLEMTYGPVLRRHAISTWGGGQSLLREIGPIDFPETFYLRVFLRCELARAVRLYWLWTRF